VSAIVVSPTTSTGEAPVFSGLWIPLITPFRHGEVDHPALHKLVTHYASQGIAGLVVCGSTGEAAALDDAEQLAVLQTVLSAVNAGASKVPVVMGVSGYHQGKVLAWVKTLAAYPLAGFLLPAPNYIRPSQAGLQGWFRAIADAAALPIIVYDIPYRTGVELQLETLLALAAHPNIQAIKDCGGDAAKTSALIADGRLAVLAGDDANIFSAVAAGAKGAIAASAHLQAVAFARVILDLQQGNLATARTQWQALSPLVKAMFAEPNPACIKAALASLGLIANELRAPMVAANLPPAGTWGLV
jgi:4-hydroxy-tetrahydrodipicolinate synthase